MSALKLLDLERHHATVLHASEIGDISFPSREIGISEIIEMGVTASSGQDLHELD